MFLLQKLAILLYKAAKRFLADVQDKELENIINMFKELQEDVNICLNSCENTVRWNTENKDTKIGFNQTNMITKTRQKY